MCHLCPDPATLRDDRKFGAAASPAHLKPIAELTAGVFLKARKEQCYILTTAQGELGPCQQPGCLSVCPLCSMTQRAHVLAAKSDDQGLILRAHILEGSKDCLLTSVPIQYLHTCKHTHTNIQTHMCVQNKCSF